MQAAVASDVAFLGGAEPSSRLPRLRRDLTIRRTLQRGEVFFVVRNAEADKYYRFRPTEHAVLRLLDGRSTPEQVARRFEEDNPGRSLSASAVEQFVDTLRHLELLERSPVEKSLALYERLRKERARRRSPFQNVMFLKKKLYDPDREFARLLRIFGFCWRPGFLWFSVGLIAAAVALVGFEWRAFTSTYGAFLLQMADLDHAASNYMLMLFTFFWMAIIHESCHGMTCKHFGGEVHEVGMLLLYLQAPGFYCNVNDAWTFPKRSHRLWVTFAGGYSGIILAAGAVFAWWLTPPGLVHRHAFAVITIGFLGGLLSNYNPLLKLDGYYMLLDLVEVPNLQDHSWKHLGFLFKRHVLRLPVEPLPAPPRVRRIYLTYGILSLLYITLMMTTFLIIAAMMFHRKLEEAGWLLFLALLGVFLARPLRSVAATARFFVTDKREWLRSGRGLAALGAGVALLVAVLFLPRLPFRVIASGTVEVAERVLVHTAAPGRIEEVITPPGAQVRSGQAILRLSSPALRAWSNADEAQVRETEALLAVAEASGKPAESALLRRRLEGDRAAASRSRLRRESLVVRATATGVLDAPLLRSGLGRVVHAGTVLGEILRPGPRRIRLRVPERLVGDVHAGARAEMKTAAFPARIFRGQVVEILPERAPDDAAERRAAEVDPTLVPQAFYIVVVAFDDPEGLLRPGTRGRVRILCGRLSPAGFLGRRWKRFFGGKVWL